MTVQEFQKQIRSGDIDRVIILYGEEVAVMDEYLSHLYKAIKLKPTAAKGTYVKSIYLSSTMSPGIAIDTKSVN